MPPRKKAGAAASPSVSAEQCDDPALSPPTASIRERAAPKMLPDRTGYAAEDPRTTTKPASKRKPEESSEVSNKRAKPTKRAPETSVDNASDVAESAPSIQTLQSATTNGTSKAKKGQATKPKKAPSMLNQPPNQVLDVYVFGEGSGGELGLGAIGSKNNPVMDVTQPRLNRFLSAETAGVVQVAVGSVHCVALTKDNRILTWGVNDQGVLGRETPSLGREEDDEDILVLDYQPDAGSLRSPKARHSKKPPKMSSHDPRDDPIDSGLNPFESEPAEIDMEDVPEGTIFASVYASENTSFAVTTDGKVFGWGSFRGNDSVLGFRPGIGIQRTPMLIPELKHIRTMACGANHALALDTKGKVFTWGAGEQNQLARRVVSRTAAGALIPREFGLGKKKIAKISCGDFHSFAVTDKGEVYAWGSNTFGQTGVKKGEAGTEEEDTVLKPTLADAFVDLNIEQIVGGAHHSVACTREGKILVIGRVDGAQAGTDLDKIPEETLQIDEHDRERYLIKPICHTAKSKAVWVATRADTSLAISSAENGKNCCTAYSWGFSSSYQTGQGTDEDVVEITPITNEAVKGKYLVGGGIGAHFGLLLGIHEPAA